MEKRSRLWSAAVAVCTVVLICSVFGIGRTLWNARKETKTFDQLIQLAEEAESAGQPAGESRDRAGNRQKSQNAENAGEEMPRRNYAKLKAENPDFAGWMRIAGTKIDYPVMHTPEDIQYYIRRDFYGNSTVSGTPFIGDSCDTDSGSMIIYGHNMKNGTMFGELDEYQSKDYRDEHPILEFYTEDEAREYEIFAAFHTKLVSDGEPGFPYYKYVGDLTEDQFHEFMEHLGAVSYYGSGNWPQYGEQLVMLSTCSYHTENGRFVVVGRRVDGQSGISGENGTEE